MTHAATALVMLALLLGGCGGFPVHVSTPNPLKVDVTMRVDIFQHARQTTDDTAEKPAEPEAAAKDTIESRRRDRMPEIQRFKNSRLVGENHYGLLTIRDAPAGPYGQRVKETVDAENADRDALMKTLAAQHHVARSRIEADQAELWRERAFPGEWIEQQQADGTWQWVQKRAADSGGAGSSGGAGPATPTQP
jgi:uncharacterized protein YdbL (DUF1318 family)